jgi:hypothetical protein
VTPTEIAVSYIDPFCHSSLSFGLCEAFWLVSYTILQQILWQCLIYASIGVVIGSAVAIALINHQWVGKSAYILLDFGH